MSQQITQDRECEQCGYSLRGLYTSGECPECGLPIRSRRGPGASLLDNLVDAPIWYLKLLVMAMSATACVGVVMTLGQVYLAVSGFSWRWVVQAVSPVVWAAAVWFVTWKRPRDSSTSRDEVLDAKWLRMVIRVTQFAWPIGVGLVVAPGILSGAGVAVPGYGAGVLITLGGLLLMVSVLGLVPLCVYLSALADWAGEEGVSERLRASAFFMGVFGMVAVVSSLLEIIPGFLIGPIFGVASVISALLAVIGLILMVVSLVQMAFMTSWAVRNWHDIVERDMRVEARRKEREAERSSRVSRMASAMHGREQGVGIEGSGGVQGPAPMRVSASEHRLDRASDDAAPIEIDGEAVPVGPGQHAGFGAGPGLRAEPGVHQDPVEQAHADQAPIEQQRFGNEHVRERSEDVTPFGLEPDEPDR